jgi:hypothetical protein
LTHKSKASWPALNACACTVRVLALTGRYLLILTALSLITMPITEHLWTWDRFLQGGRDFELGTLALLSFLSLVLVLAKGYKQCVDVLISARRWLAVKFNDLVVPRVPLSGASSNLCRVVPPDPGTCISDIPLQI